MLYHNYCDLLLCNIIDIAGVCDDKFSFTKNHSMDRESRIFMFLYLLLSSSIFHRRIEEQVAVRLGTPAL